MVLVGVLVEDYAFCALGGRLVLFPGDGALASGGLDPYFVFFELKGDGVSLVFAVFELTADLPGLDGFAEEDGVDGEEDEGEGEVFEFGVPEGEPSEAGEDACGEEDVLVGAVGGVFCMGPGGVDELVGGPFVFSLAGGHEWGKV